MTNHLLVLHVPVNGFCEGLIHNFPKDYGETDLTAVPQAIFSGIFLGQLYLVAVFFLSHCEPSLPLELFKD